jgi:hypothetical protein
MALVMLLICSGVGGRLLSGLLEVESLELRVESCVFTVRFADILAFVGFDFRGVAIFVLGVGFLAVAFLFAMILYLLVMFLLAATMTAIVHSNNR